MRVCVVSAMKQPVCLFQVHEMKSAHGSSELQIDTLKDELDQLRVWKDKVVLDVLLPPPSPPHYHISDVMLVWRKLNINRTVSATVQCTIIMVHNSTSSSYRSMNLSDFCLTWFSSLHGAMYI